MCVQVLTLCDLLSVVVTFLNIATLLIKERERERNLMECIDKWIKRDMHKIRAQTYSQNRDRTKEKRDAISKNCDVK